LLYSLAALSRRCQGIGRQLIVMDHEPLVMNRSSSSWTIRQGVEVALTFLGQYYTGRGVVVRVTSTDLLLVLVSVIEVSDAIEIPLHFPVDDVRHIS
jgi:hypothetical protein